MTVEASMPDVEGRPEHDLFLRDGSVHCKCGWPFDGLPKRWHQGDVHLRFPKVERAELMDSHDKAFARGIIRSQEARIIELEGLLAEAESWAAQWHKVVETLLTINGSSPAMSAEEALAAFRTAYERPTHA